MIDSEIIIDDVDALINGEFLDFECLPNQQFNNVTLRKMDNIISALLSSGVNIEVKVENGNISVLSATLPLIYKSETAGLMGNYNGDQSDDLLPRGKEEPIYHHPLAWRKFTKILESPVSKILYLVKIMAIAKAKNS